MNTDSSAGGLADLRPGAGLFVLDFQELAEGKPADLSDIFICAPQFQSRPTKVVGCVVQYLTSCGCDHGHVGVEKGGAAAERWRLDGLAGEAGRGGGVGGGGEGAGRTGRGGDPQVLRVLARVLLPAAGEGEVGGWQGGRQRELVLVVDGEVVVQLG